MEQTRLEQILEMLNADPADSFLNYALALEYEKAGKPEEAIRMLEKLLERDPSYTGAYYKLGQLYESVKELKKAADCYRRGVVLTQQQGHTRTWRELKEALQQLDDQ
ncbi:MAG: tetratricopeptide repeat protein [Bacteroidia bacterium]